MDKALVKALGNIKSFSRKAMFMKRNADEEEGINSSSPEIGIEMPEMDEADEEEKEVRPSQKYTLLMMSGRRMPPVAGIKTTSAKSKKNK